MRNYLKAELFRNFHRMYLWGYIICFIGLGFLACLSARYFNYHNDAQITVEVIIGMGVSMIPGYTYLMMLFNDISLGEEIKNNTIKNIVSSGMSREKIYLCKFVEAFILMAFCTLIIFLVNVLMAVLLLDVQSNANFMNALHEGLTRGIVAMFLWSGAIALSLLFFMIFSSGTLAIGMYIVVMTLMKPLLNLLGNYINPMFYDVREYLLTTQLNYISSGQNLSNEESIMAIVIGIIYTISMIFIGMRVLKVKNL